ncbi:glycoside hydrolase family 5 protein [Erythrobacter sp. F6033]|uniref:glycoside hydrolase family 5 protein n=1 Tax=Erythrobacter sp. F6033 TaxID=2926401 RepID=UPI001FF469DB|nr:glycoside hydrolase family 5 protein [Erythrobacter sp. F6033]MCK0127430.1 glycoside hydrolase family 5 protein [Erythrobacter sp. F6033]
MANHLEANPTEGDWGRAINNTDFADIAAVGFETIRLPVRWSNKASATPPYTIDAAWMQRVEDVVGQARAAGLRVILNDHHYDAIFENPDAEKERFAAIWKQVAERFQGADDMVWFELLNEPHNQITDANLLSILEPALAEVRATNPTRPVVVGGQNYSGINSLATLPLPNDPYLIATFHFYDPFPFTHQGAPWVTPVQPVGATYGSAADQQELEGAVQKARDFMTSTGRPVFLGEYGAYDPIPMDQRVSYYSAVSTAFRGADVDGCIWGYTNSFAFRDQNTGVWHQQLLDAIGL